MLRRQHATKNEPLHPSSAVTALNGGCQGVTQVDIEWRIYVPAVMTLST